MEVLDFSELTREPRDRDRLLNDLKGVEERLMRLCDGLAVDREADPEPNGLAIARAHLELGFLELFRAVLKPETHRGYWVLERADTDPDAPLYYAPAGGEGGTQWTGYRPRALHLSGKDDAGCLASALGIQCRVVNYVE